MRQWCCTQELLKLLTLFLVLVSASAFGQTPSDTTQSSKNENVTVYGTSNPVIQNAYQRFSQPGSFTIKNNLYQSALPFVPFEFNTRINIQTLKPEAIETYVPQSNWNNIFRGGLGSRLSPYAELFHSQGKQDSYRWNVHLFHYSSFLKIKNYLPSPYTNTLVESSYKRFFPYHILSFGAKYRINSLRYYGFNTSNDTLNYNPNNNELKQWYQLADFKIAFSDTYRSFEKLHYNVSGKGYYFADRYGMVESHIDANLDVHKAFEVTNIFNHQQVGIRSQYQLYKEDNPYQERTDNFIKIMPYIDARYGIISFKAGLQVQWLQVTGKKLYAFPFLVAQMEIIPDAFSIFAGVDGGLHKNSYYDLVAKNPYLYSYDNSYQWENNKFQIHAGFKGNIARRLGFEMEAGVKFFQNKSFFDYVWSNTYKIPASDSVMQYVKNAFYVSYADGNQFYISGGLTYENSEQVKIWLTAMYREFSLNNNLKPLYEPAIQVQLGSSIRFTKKISGQLDARYVGERWASYRVLAGGSVISNPYYKLPDYIDLNLEMNYKIDDQFGGFVKLSNLLNQHYWLFNEYPVAGLEVMLGISYRF